MDTCANCNAPFKERDKGFYRFSLEKTIPATGKPARCHLETIFNIPVTPVSKKTDAKFLCYTCWSDLNAAVKYNKSASGFLESTASTSYVGSKRVPVDIASPSKRPRFTSTPLKTKSKAARPIFGKSKTIGKSKTSKWDTIITAIRSRHYRRGFTNLYNATTGTKRQFNEFVVRQVRKEMNTLLNFSEFPLSKEVSIGSISDFSWVETLYTASEKAPILFNVLKGAVTTKSNHESMIRHGKVNLKPHIGTALAILMNAKAPSKAKFLHTLLSVQFWRGRLKRETMKQLAHLGLCSGYEATLSAIDRIRAKFDEAAIELKKNMEVALESHVTHPVTVEEDDHEVSFAMSASNVEDEIAYYSDMEETILYSDIDSTFMSTYSKEESNHDLSDNDREDGDSEEDGNSGEDSDSVEDSDSAEDSERKIGIVSGYHRGLRGAMLDNFFKIISQVKRTLFTCTYVLSSHF